MVLPPSLGLKAEYVTKSAIPPPPKRHWRGSGMRVWLRGANGVTREIYGTLAEKLNTRGPMDRILMFTPEHWVGFTSTRIIP